ncbi:MAG: SidE phosphodiesterase domain-containing protein [Coxiellaceae bacterium]|nr:SidE phosphodiesterase domain-containing protein [Coxiellaceae bacterium]
MSRVHWLKAFTTHCDRAIDVNKGMYNLTLKHGAYRNPFYNIKKCARGDLVRQVPFNYQAAHASYQLVVVAAALVSKHRLFKQQHRPLIIPTRGARVSETYYKAATHLLDQRLRQLNWAYQYHLDLLKKALLVGQQSSIAASLNYVKQIQQFMAGAQFLRTQYMLMRPDTEGRYVVLPDAYQQCMTSAKGIAKRFANVLLDEPSLQKQLIQAVMVGDVDRMHVLLAEPEVDINKPDITTGQTALYTAVQSEQFKAVKTLTRLGASESIDIDAEHSALTLAMIRKDVATVEYLKSNLAITREIHSDALHQGPAQKNLALKTVEYIFRCMLGIEHISNTLYEAELYAVKYTDAGDPFPFILEKDDSHLWFANCPNGRRYNLSLALKHANFDYWMLDESSQSLEIIKRCERELSGTDVDGEAKRADKLTTDIGGSAQAVPLYATEQVAIHAYTDEESEAINALLRAMPCNYPNKELEKTFIRAMLMVSGINKHRSSSDFEQRKLLTRGETNKLPVDMLERMKTESQVVLRAAPLSFSQNMGFSRITANRIQLTDRKQRHACVELFSKFPREKEVIFPPSYLRFSAYKQVPGSKKRTFMASIVRGAEVEYQQTYLLELAQREVHEILKNPYKEVTDPRFGVARHNHALAHHMRVSMLVRPTIDYFKHHAAADEFKHFCHHLTPQEVIIMQVMMMFSRVGRESEAGPSQLETFLRYNRLSAEAFARFLRQHMDIDDETIAFYSDVLVNAGNPRYADLVTGATDEEKQRKLYFSYIAALAHKLDLPRVFGRAHYEKELSAYNGASELVTGGYLVKASKQQEQSFGKLESIAMNMLRKTGDNLSFSKHGIEAGHYNKDEFVKCNTDLSYCQQQCVIAHMEVLRDHQAESKLVKALKQAIDDNQADSILHALLRFTKDDFAQFESRYRISVATAMVQAPHNYVDLITECASMLAYDANAAWLFFSRMVMEGNYPAALQVLPTVATERLVSATVILVEKSAPDELIDAVLLRVQLIETSDTRIELLFVSAISAGCSPLVAQKIIDLGVVVNADRVMAALRRHVDTAVVDLLIENMVSFAYLLPETVAKMICYGHTPQQQLTLLHTVVAKGFDVNERYKGKNLLFHLITLNSSAPIIQQLLSVCGVVTAADFLDILSHFEQNDYNHEIKNMLLAALDIEKLSVADIAKILMSSRDAVVRRALLDAHVIAHGAILRVLLLMPADDLPAIRLTADKCAVVAIKSIIDYRDEPYVDHCLDIYGRTELMLAIKSGKEAVVDVLLDAGAATDAFDIYGNTPLTYALMCETSSMAEKLLHTTQPSLYFNGNKFGLSPLALAMRRQGMQAHVTYMVEHGDIAHVQLRHVTAVADVSLYKDDVYRLAVRFISHLYETTDDNSFFLDVLAVVQRKLGREIAIIESADFSRLASAMSCYRDFKLAQELVKRCDVSRLTPGAYDAIAANVRHHGELGKLTQRYIEALTQPGGDGKLDVLYHVADISSKAMVGPCQLDIAETIASAVYKHTTSSPAECRKLLKMLHVVLQVMRGGAMVRVGDVERFCHVLADKAVLMSIYAVAVEARSPVKKVARSSIKRFYNFLKSKHCGLIFRVGYNDESEPDDMRLHANKRCSIS